MSAPSTPELVLPHSPTDLSAGNRSYWRMAWHALRASRLGLFAAGFLITVALVAICAPLLATYVTHQSATANDLTVTFGPPSRSHWLGTDQLGRDTLTRLIYGARVSLAVGFLTVSVQLVVGATVGLTAGYFGGWLDDLLMRIVDAVLAFPAIFLFLLLAAILRPNLLLLSLIIASVGWAVVARLVRGEVITIKNRDFMLATRSLGARHLRLMWRHVMPNVLPVLIVSASFYVGQIILAEAALDFLGLGIQPPTASWGNMLSSAQTYVYHSIWLVVFPGLAIASTVLAVNVFGNVLRDALDPRLQNVL
jgi:peptide/nickel transport system permease protein